MTPSDPLSPIDWAALNGVPRAPQPAVLDLYNVLASTGIVADVEIVPSATFQYADLDDAVSEVRERLHLPKHDPSDVHLRALLADRLVPADDGRLTWSARPDGNAIVHWTNA